MIRIGPICIGRPKPLESLEEILLVRHGQSKGNTGEEDPREIGDPNLALTEKGRAQARAAGARVGPAFLRECLHYRSPYLRNIQTSDCMLEGAGVTGVRIYEDIRLREVEFGYDDVPSQENMRKVHGWMFYRFRGGESPADCYDRTSAALESILRQVERKRVGKVMIVSHGLTIRCFVARFFHLTVEQFESLANPANCDVIRIARENTMDAPQFMCGRWGVTGLKLR